MPAKGIIDFVKEKTGKKITISLKSKKSIIAHAKKLLYGQPGDNKPKKSVENKIPIKNIVSKPMSSLEKIDFSNMSSKEIIRLVKEKTGQSITINLKSKKSIIKHAQRIFVEKGLHHKI